MKIQSAAVYSYERIIASLEAYRLFNPMIRANLRINPGIVDNQFSTDAVRESDIVVFQREFPARRSNYLSLISTAANLGKPVVMDMDDDLLALPTHHPDRIKLNYAKAQIPILIGMVQSAALTVTTPYLADLLRKFNSNIFILPNYLDDSLWKFNAPQVEPAGEKIRIFYIGTITHVPDLEMLKPAFRALAMKYPGRLEFMFYGANLQLEENIPAVVTNCQSETFVFSDYVRIALAQKANIAIAPLEDIPYNHCKSSIKFFEYAAMGLPGVYSRVTPYTSVIEEGVNGFTAASISEWIDSLSQLIENPELRGKMALSAQATVRRDWLLSDHAYLWPETYARIAELTTPNKAPIAAYLPVLKDITLHLDTFFTKQEQKSSDLSWQLQQAKQNLEQQTADNDDLHNRLDILIGDNSHLNSELALTNQALSVKSEEIEGLHSELALANQALSAKSEEIIGLHSEIDLIRKDMDQLSIEKTISIETNSALKEQVDNLSVQWLDHTKQIQILESENRYVKEGWDATKLEAVHYSLSRSWRLTRPMRKFIKFFKGK